MNIYPPIYLSSTTFSGHEQFGQDLRVDENLDLKLSWIYLNEDPSLWGSGN